MEEFASDQLYNTSAVSKETVQNELTQLGVTKTDTSNGSDDSDKNEDWDELKAELDELDLGETEGSSTFPADWEEELQSMLSEDSKETWKIVCFVDLLANGWANTKLYFM